MTRHLPNLTPALSRVSNLAANHELGFDAGALASRYPHVGEYLAVRERWDPERVFVNPFLAQVLGLRAR
jgi:hypothetical protein